MKKSFYTSGLYLLTITISIVQISCERSTNPPFNNQAPETYITNIPAENDTIFPLVTLYWNGGDIDGFVSGYEYRYITTFLNRGDSVVQDWTKSENTFKTITFVSSDKLNRQRFQVRAIDNEGLADPTPAEKILYTEETIAPVPQIIHPVNNQEFFVLDEISDWWRGIPLNFQASDADGEVLEFGWSVDGSDWVWTSDTTINLTPELFASPVEGKHEIRVTALDNTELTAIEPATVTIELVKPAFNKTLLIIDETDENNWPAGIDAEDDSVDTFYRNLFAAFPRDQWDEWDYVKDGPPSRQFLGQYKLLLWHGDDKPSSKPHALTENVDLFKDYTNVGGDFVLSGWRMLKSFVWQERFPVEYDPESFVYRYLHVEASNETPLGADFTYAAGQGSFSDVSVDSEKLDGVFPYFGSLANINLITDRGPFTEVIYTYGTSNQTRYPEYRGMACGLLYYGSSFNAVVLGFPLFFIEYSDAKILADQILINLNYK